MAVDAIPLFCGRAKTGNVFTDIQSKKDFIINNKLALWDSLESCEINGASDTSIKNPIPNNIAGLVGKTNIKAIFCNGAASYKYYNLYCCKTTKIEAIKLPSTSPANAAYGMEKLKSEWEIITRGI